MEPRPRRRARIGRSPGCGTRCGPAGPCGCGPAAEQIGRPPDGLAIQDWTNELDDFADTAALIAALDLVITVDTATAHLAGALGKPVWILTRHDACWRWLTGRSDSPWYPTATLFRQPHPGDWGAVFAEVAAALVDATALPARRGLIQG